MKPEEVVERVCRMPVDFYTLHTKSMVQLVAESGIEEFPEALTVANVAAYIADHPDLVEEWLAWSANQRVGSSWYFSRREGACVVSFYPKGESPSSWSG